MTCIAIRSGIVAFDSRVSSSSGECSSGVIDKCWIGERHPVIYCGYGILTAWYQAAMFIENGAKLPWQYKRWNNKDFPDLGEDSGLALIDRDGAIYCFEGKHFFKMKSTMVAFGSGATAANSAMLLGADAEEAVNIAIELDNGSGPPVNVLRIADIPERPRRKRK